MGPVPSKLRPLLSFGCCLHNIGILAWDPRVNDHMSRDLLYFMDASQVDVALGGHIVIQLSVQLGRIARSCWYDQAVLQTDQMSGFGIVYRLPQ